MKPSQQFPKSAGWITAKLTVKKGANFTEQDAREVITFGKPHTAQFGLIETNCNPVKIIYRPTKIAAMEGDTNPVEVEFDIHSPIPFIAKCGNLIVQVAKVREEFLPFKMIRCQILRGRHFNDQGDFGPGDEVTIGPLTDHWKILTFPDSVPA